MAGAQGAQLQSSLQMKGQASEMHRQQEARLRELAHQHEVVVGHTARAGAKAPSNDDAATRVYPEHSAAARGRQNYPTVRNHSAETIAYPRQVHSPAPELPFDEDMELAPRHVKQESGELKHAPKGRSRSPLFNPPKVVAHSAAPMGAYARKHDDGIQYFRGRGHRIM